MLLGTLCSALSTGLGACLIWLFKDLNHKGKDSLLAFSAGVMLSAVVYGLLPEAKAHGSVWVLILGVFIGVVTLHAMERTLPHMDLVHNNQMDIKTILVVGALVLHNIPEGLSVGVSYADKTESIGGAVAFAIGLQNLPEGLLCALFLSRSMAKWKTVIISTLTGFVELIAAYIGYGVAYWIEGLIPLGLSFAGGAMLYLVFVELIPESHGDGNARISTYPFVGGILLMMILLQTWN
ncbi:ZIP family metal transporter [Bacillus luti]|nr:ZIP family metal transporter [Bacillus cereus]HDR8328227.1 ZIP family metal transporter [Bacillus cereus]HDR8337454.1 ZIP family metal transporter [Bacillus cereus]